MEYFFIHPTVKLRVRQIERVTKAPLPSVIRYTKELEKEEILKRSIVANVTLFCANRASKAFLLEKTLYNLRKIHASGLISFLQEELSNPAIVVFGSYAKGEDIEESDIDLYIETLSKKKIDVVKYEKDIGRKIQLFTYRKFCDIENKELANNIVNGIILVGFLEVL